MAFASPSTLTYEQLGFYELVARKRAHCMIWCPVRIGTTVVDSHTGLSALLVTHNEAGGEWVTVGRFAPNPYGGIRPEICQALERVSHLIEDQHKVMNDA